MPPLRIGFLSNHNPLDRSSWSGTMFYLHEALRTYAGDVTIVAPQRSLEVKLVSKLNQILGRLFKAELSLSQSVPLSKAYGRQFGPAIDPAKLDVLFAPVASNEVAYLETKVPIVYLSDATFKALENYYFSVDEVGKRYLEHGTHLESRAIERSSAIVYCSDWAAESARKDYGARAGKVHTVPLGANMDYVPGREELSKGSSDGRCRLLFVGRDWQRKGGQIALDTLRALREKGVDAELTIVGCRPPQPIEDANVVVIPLLNKKVEEDRRRLEELYRTSDFFLLPTRAECYGIVFCEASAYGLPVVSTATGGVTTIVKDGVNGYLLPLQDGGAQYAEVIAKVWSDPEGYQRLRATTRDRYDTVLNWRSWAESVRRVMETVVAEKSR